MTRAFIHKARIHSVYAWMHKSGPASDYDALHWWFVAQGMSDTEHEK